SAGVRCDARLCQRPVEETAQRPSLGRLAERTGVSGWFVMRPRLRQVGPATERDRTHLSRLLRSGCGRARDPLQTSPFGDGPVYLRGAGDRARGRAAPELAANGPFTDMDREESC